MTTGPQWTAEPGSPFWYNADAPGYRVKDVPGGYEVYQGETLLEPVTTFAEAIGAVEIAMLQAGHDLAGLTGDGCE